MGLSDIVLDLHGAPASKRKLAQDLARSLADASSIVRPDLSSLQDKLVLRRKALVAHDDAMHSPREPWQISVYEILCRRLGLPESCQSALLVSPETLTAPVYEQARHDLREYANLGGHRLRPGTSPWAIALISGTVTTASQAEAALSCATTLAGQTWPRASERLRTLAGQCGLRVPADVAGWASVLELLGATATTSEFFDKNVFSLPLDDLATAMEPAGRGAVRRAVATLSNGRYRSALKQLRCRVLARRKAGRSSLAQCGYGRRGPAASLAVDEHRWDASTPSW